MTKRRCQQGLTLIEILIVVSILIILLLILLMSWRNQINKARDAQRKEDLNRLRTAFEEYFNDNQCYPQPDILDICEGTDLSPYLEKIPCDPITHLPYCYIPEYEDCPQFYRLLARLQNSSDPDILDLKCSAEDPYCGWEDICADPSSYYSGFNYGLGSSNVTVPNPEADFSSPSPSAGTTPPPSSLPGSFACDPDGVCNSYADTSSCGLTFNNYTLCNNYCPTSDPSERCAY